jgi:hypothetical protein
MVKVDTPAGEHPALAAGITSHIRTGRKMPGMSGISDGGMLQEGDTGWQENAGTIWEMYIAVLLTCANIMALRVRDIVKDGPAAGL